MGIITGMENLPNSGGCFQVGGQQEDSMANSIEGLGQPVTLEAADRTTRMLELVLQQQQNFMTSFMQQQHAMMTNFLEQLGNNRRQNTTEAAPLREVGGTSEPVVVSPSRPVSTSTPISNNPDLEWKQIALALSANNSKIPSMERPVFRGHFRKNNPVVFLDTFEKYFKSLKCNEREKLDIVLSCLEYPASQWVELKQASWTTFQDFKRDFFSQYWSESKQQQIRSDILLTRFDSSRSTMSEHFIRQINNARTLTIPLPELVIVEDVMRQFPANIQSLWSVFPQRNISGALEFINRQENCTVRRNKVPETSVTNDPEKRKTPYHNSKFVNVLQNVRVPPPDSYATVTTEPNTARASTSSCCKNCLCHNTNSENFRGTN